MAMGDPPLPPTQTSGGAPDEQVTSPPAPPVEPEPVAVTREPSIREMREDLEERAKVAEASATNGGFVNRETLLGANGSLEARADRVKRMSLALTRKSLLTTTNDCVQNNSEPETPAVMGWLAEKTEVPVGNRHAPRLAAVSRAALDEKCTQGGEGGALVMLPVQATDDSSMPSEAMSAKSRSEVAGGGSEVAGSGSEVAGGGSEVAGSGSEVAGGGSEVAGGGSEVAGGGNRPAVAPPETPNAPLTQAALSWLADETAAPLNHRHAARLAHRTPTKTVVEEELAPEPASATLSSPPKHDSVEQPVQPPSASGGAFNTTRASGRHSSSQQKVLGNFASSTAASSAAVRSKPVLPQSEKRWSIAGPHHSCNVDRSTEGETATPRSPSLAPKGVELTRELSSSSVNTPRRPSTAPVVSSGGVVKSVSVSLVPDRGPKTPKENAPPADKPRWVGATGGSSAASPRVNTWVAPSPSRG
jgi:hypothetical protein